MSQRLVAAIGMFDGVHRGHRHLLDTVCREAEKRGIGAAAVTFSRHPSSVLRPDSPVRLLSGTKDKTRMLESCGLRVIMLDFTEKLRGMTSREFLRMLHDDYGVDCLVVGFNNRFGSDREHGISDYRRFGAEIGVDIVEATEIEDCKVSSSLIRAMLESGRVEDASKALGRDYCFTGKVVEGCQLGRQLGFPTANIAVSDLHVLVPAPGVYTAYVTDEDSPGIRRMAMVNIGSRPTVNSGSDVTIEAHILDYNGNLYGHTLTVEFHQRIRDERRYPSLDRLVSALATDAAVTRSLLK